VPWSGNGLKELRLFAQGFGGTDLHGGERLDSFWLQVFGAEGIFRDLFVKGPKKAPKEISSHRITLNITGQQKTRKPLPVAGYLHFSGLSWI
jgi:hypothetical protein